MCVRLHLTPCLCLSPPHIFLSLQEYFPVSLPKPFDDSVIRELQNPLAARLVSVIDPFSQPPHSTRGVIFNHQFLTPNDVIVSINERLNEERIIHAEFMFAFARGLKVMQRDHLQQIDFCSVCMVDGDMLGYVCHRGDNRICQQCFAQCMANTRDTIVGAGGITFMCSICRSSFVAEPIPRHSHVPFLG